MTSKAQTTIPQPVRVALGLAPGDDIAYAIEHGRVVMTRFAASRLAEDPFPTFSEWESAEDAEAYVNL